MDLLPTLNCSIAEFARKHKLPRTTVANHMNRGWCTWPRRILDGITDNPAYKCWENMVQRATNFNLKGSNNYVERGIDIYPPWIRDFRLFLAHIGPRPGVEYSIDRVDNNKGYWPGNVRWATTAEQNINKRTAIRSTKNGIEKHGNWFRFKYKGKHLKFKTEEEALIFRHELKGW